MMFEPTCRPETPYNPADRLYPIVRCMSCYAEVTGKNEDYFGKTAIAAWNRRPAQTYTQDQLDAAVRAERERCATKAHGWLKNWAADLFGTWESYIEAKASGRHNGRRMSEGDADMFAKQFRERAEAVDDCADHVAAAIRELDLHAQGRPQAAGA